MDQTRKFTGIAAPATDHAPLVAAAAVTQAATRTAMLAERMRRHRPAFADSHAALVAIFAGDDAVAASVLQGSFHPRVAATLAGHSRARSVNTVFTFAF